MAWSASQIWASKNFEVTSLVLTEESAPNKGKGMVDTPGAKAFAGVRSWELQCVLKAKVERKNWIALPLNQLSLDLNGRVSLSNLPRRTSRIALSERYP